MSHKKLPLILLLVLLETSMLIAQQPIRVSVEVLKDSFGFSKKLNYDSSNFVSLKYKLHITNQSNNVLYLPIGYETINNPLVQIYLYNKDIGLITVLTQQEQVNPAFTLANNLLALQPGKTHTLNHSVDFASTYKMVNANKNTYSFTHGDVLLQEYDSLHNKVYTRLPNSTYQLFALLSHELFEDCYLVKPYDAQQSPNLIASDTALFVVYGEYPEGIITFQKKNQVPHFPGGMQALKKAICLSFDTLDLSKRKIRQLLATDKMKIGGTLTKSSTYKKTPDLIYHFTFDTTGKVRLINNVNPKNAIDVHIAKVVNRLPLSVPAMVNGIRTPYNIMIAIKLNSKNKSKLQCACSSQEK